MKAFCFSLLVAIACLAWTVPAGSGEFAIAPNTLDEVINVTFRSALASQASDYDSLDRNEQVRVFTQVYRSLNRGQDPLLSPDDAGLLAGVPATAAPVVPPAAYQNTQSGDIYQLYGNYGYRRFPAVTPNPPPLGVSVVPAPFGYRAGTPLVGLGRPEANASHQPQAPLPYERPPVATPRRAPTAHAGP
ncbi:MAG: hypothetical protein LUE17_06130 [Planctomycetaceae bacterium]|nr:hypothetical protein [Planctomycetaceae bacterium]